MTGSVLLFGSDLSWREALQRQIEMEEGWSVASAHEVNDAQNKFRAAREPFTAAVIAAFGNVQSNGPEAAIAISKTLRTVAPNLPMLFDISVPDYFLTAYVLRCPPARFFSSKQEAIVPALHVLQNMRAGTLPKRPPRFAVFEVTCEVASVTFTANLDCEGDPVGPYPVPWIEDRKLRELDHDFQSFRLMEPDPPNGRRAAREWSAKLKRAGSEISQALGLDSGAQAAVLAAFVKELKQLEHVHFRFNLPNDRMKHIPFELVWDGNRERHLRARARRQAHPPARGSADQYAPGASGGGHRHRSCSLHSIAGTRSTPAGGPPVRPQSDIHREGAAICGRGDQEAPQSSQSRALTGTGRPSAL